MTITTKLALRSTLMSTLISTLRSTLMSALAIATSLLLVTGCSGTETMQGGGEAAGSDAAGQVAPAGPERARDAQQGAQGGTATGAAGTMPDLGRDVIRRAQLTVHTKRLGAALEEARTLVRDAGGIVSDERTSSDDDGVPQRSVLTLRVPADRFADVLDDLAALGDVQEQQASSEDVTLQVIDVEARIASAEQALARLRELLERAEDLDDVVRLENELARRESDLEALKSQHAYLADQTSLSTITLTLRRPPKHEPVDEEPAGFVGGLSTGWDALVGLLGVGATTLGVLLPFLLLLALVLPPTWLLVRRTRVWNRQAS